MFGWIERPAAAGSDERAGDVADAACELGGKCRCAALGRSHSNIIARMRTVDVIRRKRDGGTLRRREIEHFVAGVTDGTIPDYQAAALLMAIVLRGMSADETAQLTDAMVRSGVRVEFDGQFGIPVDKHSTGGVGDKTSLILAPLAVACGAAVPMMSGRGLGHTGGTLDKLESIPGFRTALSLEEFRAAVAAVGGALDRPDRRDRAGRPAALRAARRHRHGREHPADLGVDHEQEDRRRHRRARPRRQDGRRRVHEDARRLAPAGAVAGGDRQRVRRQDRSGRHPDGRAARPGSRQRQRGHREHRDAEGEGARRSRTAVGAPRRPHARARRRCRHAGRRRTLASAGRSPRGRASRRSGASSSTRAAIRASSTTTDACRRAPDEHRVAAPRSGIVTNLDAEAVGRAAVALGAGRGTLDDVVDPGVGITIVAPPGAAVACRRTGADPAASRRPRAGRGHGSCSTRRLASATGRSTPSRSWSRKSAVDERSRGQMTHVEAHAAAGHAPPRRAPYDRRDSWFSAARWQRPPCSRRSPPWAVCRACSRSSA